MRYPALDALRGVAAFAVLTHHCVLAGLIPIPPGLWTALSRYTPLHPFVNGRAPVILFFVLSGFVLALALDRERLDARANARFAARRLCRIYFPYVAVVLIAAAAERLTAPYAHEVVGWQARLWSKSADASGVLQHLTMPFAWADFTLDRVAWSLVHEIRVSLLFPLLLWAARASPVTLAAASVSLFALGHGWSGCETLACLPYDGADTATSFGATAYFVPFFVLGLLLALYRRHAIGWVSRSRLLLAALWGLAIYGLIVPFKFEVLPDAAAGLAATLLIPLVIGATRASAVLEQPPLAWLGRVSFSLYLVHLLVLAIVLRLAADASAPVRLVLAIGGSLLAAELLCRSVELPCLRLSRRIGRTARAQPMPARVLLEQDLARTAGEAAL